MKTKTMKIIYWAITLSFLGFLCMGAVFELMMAPDAVKLLADLGYPAYLNTIIGVAKILGAIAIIQWKYKALREWAYAGFTIDIIGAAASAYFAVQDISAAATITLFLIPLFISYFLWKKIEAVKS